MRVPATATSRRTARVAAGLLAALALGLLGCTPPPSAGGGGAPAPTAAPLAPWAQQLVDATNAERAANGLAPLTVCPSLARAAQGHVTDMAGRDYFGHASPEGVTAAQRAQRAGYGPYVGENIAVGYDDVATVMAGWMASPGHRANILRPDYVHLGIGMARGTYQGWADRPYWAQEFGLTGTC